MLTIIERVKVNQNEKHITGHQHVFTQPQLQLTS